MKQGQEAAGVVRGVCSEALQGSDCGAERRGAAEVPASFTQKDLEAGTGAASGEVRSA